jgi:8-oxo-dGTP diphosphatase
MIVVNSFDGEAEVKEPDKCLKWEWRAWNDLPEPLFLPIVNLQKERPDLFAGG